MNNARVPSHSSLRLRKSRIPDHKLLIDVRYTAFSFPDCWLRPAPSSPRLIRFLASWLEVRQVTCEMRNCSQRPRGVAAGIEKEPGMQVNQEAGIKVHRQNPTPKANSGDGRHPPKTPDPNNPPVREPKRCPEANPPNASESHCRCAKRDKTRHDALRRRRIPCPRAWRSASARKRPTRAKWFL